MARDLTRNCLNSAKSLLRTDLLIAIAISHARLLPTTLGDNISSARHEEAVTAVACCLWASNMRTCLKVAKTFIVVPFMTSSYGPTSTEAVQDSCSSSAILLATSAASVGLD